MSGLLKIGLKKKLNQWPNCLQINIFSKLYIIVLSILFLPLNLKQELLGFAEESGFPVLEFVRFD